MAQSNALRREEPALELDLYGEAKDTALYIAKRFDASPGDVVARALGLLYFVVQEQDKERRVVSEDNRGGNRRLITISLRAGDATAERHSGG